MSKARKVGPFGNYPPGVVFFCVACNETHSVPYTTQDPPPAGPLWFFNENYEAPTIKPSLRIYTPGRREKTTCHVVVTDGVLHYCSDAGHALAGQAVPMVECKPASEHE